MSMARILTVVVAALLSAALLLPATGAGARSPFAPVLLVNDHAVTDFELEQRARLLEVMRAPGDLQNLARWQLIDEKLELQAARDAGITLDESELAEAMKAFAAQAGTDPEILLAELSRLGIEQESVESFVRINALWRKYIGERFGARVRITEEEVDRALARRGGGVRVLLNEIFLPLEPGREDEVRALAADLASRIRSFRAFEEAARRYSIGSTAAQGGRLEWLPLNRLPPQLVPIILRLSPGEVTEPIPFQQTIGIFQLRAISDSLPPVPMGATLDYLVIDLPPPDAAAEAARIAARLERCEDVYGLLRDRPEAYRRVAARSAEIPGELVMELARLDDNEHLILERPDGGRRILMLCKRTVAIEEAEDPELRNRIRQALVNERLLQLAASHLATLRARAIIRELD